jgi:Zn-dependent protease
METAMNDKLYIAATWLIPLAIAIVFHEVAHGRVAKLFGDPTASKMGRLSLNPIRHIDPFGTIILPLLLAVSGAPAFGWAKPVPVVPSRLRNPRWHMVLVAAAGPATNILLAFVTIVVMLAVIRFAGIPTGNISGFLFENVRNFITINLFLAVFNMIPMPPFDGSKVLAGFLPDGLRERFQSLDRYALFFMIGLLLIVPLVAPQFNLVGRYIIIPAAWLYKALTSAAALIV